MQIDPVQLVNTAPATGLCLLVYLELRALRPVLKAVVDQTNVMQASLDLLAQLVGVKLRRSTPSVGVPIVRPPTEQ